MDEWAQDPAVQTMRKVFKSMETSLDEILQALDISPFDFRLRVWLEKALAAFERSWGLAGQMGIRMDEKMAPAVYARCVVQVVGSEGIVIPRDLLPPEIEAERLMQEVFK